MLLTNVCFLIGYNLKKKSSLHFKKNIDIQQSFYFIENITLWKGEKVREKEELIFAMAVCFIVKLKTVFLNYKDEQIKYKKPHCLWKRQTKAVLVLWIW